MWFGAQRALLLQLAHPGVAAGVERYSTFRSLPHRRLWGTADTMLLMVWGRRDEALTAREHVMGIHDHIHGTLPEDAEPWHRGDPYDAHDANLVRWVWSTLVDTAELVFERYVGPLTDDEREALYDDWRSFGTFFGIPGNLLPTTREEFRVTYEGDLAELVVSDTAHHVGRSIVDPPLWWAPPPLVRLGRAVATSLLPGHLREAYGLTMSAEDRRLVGRLESLARRANATLPESRRDGPYTYLAIRRAVTTGIEAVRVVRDVALDTPRFPNFGPLPFQIPSKGPMNVTRGP